MDEDTLADWLWNLVAGSALGLLVVVVGSAVLLAFGAADQDSLGLLRWDTDFNPAADRDIHLWAASFSDTVTARLESGGLTFQFRRSGVTRALTRTGVNSPLTSEIAGTQIGGPSGAMVGLVFDYISESDYAAVMLNNNGYVMAYRQFGTTRDEWVPLQQWPHVLLGEHVNRLRVDIRDGRAVLRINDELLQIVPAKGNGALGVIAISRAPGQAVRFARSRCWSRQQNPRASGDST